MLLPTWSAALSFAVQLSTVVLPFEVPADDPTEAWKGILLEEAVSAHLVAVGQAVVGPVARNRLLEEIGIVPGEAVSRQTALLVARELHASRLVFGTLTPTGSDYQVEAWLLDVESGRSLGVVEDFAPAEELPELASLVAKNLIRVERDGVPAGFDLCAARRASIPLEALQAGALARVTLDPDARRAHLERALEASERYLEARVLLGELLLGEGKPREAIDVLVAARGRDRAYRDAYFDLGVAYLSADMTQAAQQVFRGLVDSEYAAQARNNLGVALMRLALFDEATEAFGRACELGLDEAACRFNLGWAYWRSGKGAKALEQFEALVASRPLDAEARLLHGAAAMSQARAEEAEESRGVALFLSPRLAEVEPGTVTGWARVAERPSPIPSSSDPGDTALLDEGLQATADLLDARDLHARGRTDEAIQLLQRRLYHEPDATFVRRELASLHTEAGALESAASELSILLWTEPTPGHHVELARLYLQMEDPTRAIDEVDRALALDPGNEDALRLKEAIGSPP